jgi:hypothetical protein
MKMVRRQLVEAGIRLEGDETAEEVFEAWQNVQKRQPRHTATC